jgi:hypothetical protein
MSDIDHWSPHAEAFLTVTNADLCVARGASNDDGTDIVSGSVLQRPQRYIFVRTLVDIQSCGQ